MFIFLCVVCPKTLPYSYRLYRTMAIGIGGIVIFFHSISRRKKGHRLSISSDSRYLQIIIPWSLTLYFFNPERGLSDLEQASFLDMLMHLLYLNWYFSSQRRGIWSSSNNEKQISLLTLILRSSVNIWQQAKNTSASSQSKKVESLVHGILIWTLLLKVLICWSWKIRY